MLASLEERQDLHELFATLRVSWKCLSSSEYRSVSKTTRLGTGACASSTSDKELAALRKLVLLAGPQIGLLRLELHDLLAGKQDRR